jgi:hypothetical protein
MHNHMNYLDKNCIMDKELNAAPWQELPGTLNFTVVNLSGDRNRVTVNGLRLRQQ